SGKAASFGARLMGSVGEQVLKQFADNFAAKVRAQQPQAPAKAQVQTAPAQQAQAVPASQDSAHAAAGTAAIAPPSELAQPLNGPALLWAAIKDWLRSLFERRTERS